MPYVYFLIDVQQILSAIISESAGPIPMKFKLVENSNSKEKVFHFTLYQYIKKKAIRADFLSISFAHLFCVCRDIFY